MKRKLSSQVMYRIAITLKKMLRSISMTSLLVGAHHYACANQEAAPPPIHQHYTITHYCGQSDNVGNQYIDKVIELAFTYHEATVTVNTLGHDCSHAREKKLLENGQSDIFWAATSEAYEASLIAIRIPIFRGLLGHRIAIIPEEDQGKYANIKTKEQLLKYKIGQGEGWTDSALLKLAGFHVIESADVDNLYKMLLADRFDLFFRGVMEPWVEVEQFKHLPLAVEKDLLVIYPMPAYLFITPHKPELAEIIEAGLWQALEDGSFDKLLVNDRFFNQALRSLKPQERNIIRLKNQTLPKTAPINDPRLWLDIQKIHIPEHVPH